MHKSGRPVTFWSAVAMGIGAMVGAGIFALLGQAGAIAASAVYLSESASESWARECAAEGAR